MQRRFFLITIFLLTLFGCKNSDNSEIIRNDLLKNIKGFIEFSEERATKIDNGKTDTNVYWVQFFEKDGKNLVVIMQQPYYDSSDSDGYLKIDENLVFFYHSDKTMVETSQLNHEGPKQVPDENSKESSLGYSAPNWAYIIKEKELEKTFIGE